MKVYNLYNGEVTIHFDELEHEYYKQHPTKGLLPVPGVTTPLKILDKPLLVGWAARMAVNYITNWWVNTMQSGEVDPADRTIEFLRVCDEAKTRFRSVAGKAADIGSKVHDFAERTLAGEDVPMPADPKVCAGAQAFLTWRESRKIEPIHTERMVFSRKYYYCGTVDFYGMIDGELCVVDFKTSSGVYPEMVFQLAGYAQALQEEFDRHIDVGWIVRLDKETGSPEAYRIKLVEYDEDGEEIYNYKEDFGSIRQIYNSVKRAERNCDALRKKAA